MKALLISILLLLTCTITIHAQERQLKEWAANYTRSDANLRPSTLTSFNVDTEEKTIRIVMGGGFPEQCFTPSIVEDIYKQVKQLLPSNMRRFDIKIEADGRPIEDLIPNIYNSKKDENRLLQETYKGAPWVTNISRPHTASQGLNGNHIALWASHGRYYKQEKRDWLWQRPRLFCTTEDLLSQTIVLPYIIPMLQNAGATVFTPRERDYQSNEVIIDNDHPTRYGTYLESNSKNKSNIKWKTTPLQGFAKTKDVYEPCDSPFTDGSARYIPAVTSARDEAKAQWIPNIPEDGKYAIYVSYQTYQNSVNDAHYVVHHKGGMTEFKVNQQMGGGTWVYLGTFEFDAGEHDYGMVTLSNISSQKGIVTADAVRFGGGMGNIAPASYAGTAQLSGLPRWAEAAKYSSQWYGFPYKIHTQPFGTNDYNNDINSRSASINYLSGGSIYNRQTQEGLRVPIDLTVAFHTDAGISKTDSTYGSLSVYMTNYNDQKTGCGEDRYVSRDLSSMFITNLHNDLKRYDWHVRQIWNRNYGEAREPLTPACILEILSHQNFNDMLLAYDPQFKFDMARSIYKTIVKFIATQYRRNYVIQPLPVNNFSIAINEKKRTATLTWNPVNDPLEPTAKAKEYIVYTRLGYQDFDNGTIVRGNSFTTELHTDMPYSFRVAAVNDGGESFPSETLSCGISSKSHGTILIMNGFTRLEGPKAVNTSTRAGFDIETDPGVPYGAFTGFCGPQTSFDRSKAGSEAKDGLGASNAGLEGQLMMGNTFDYTAIHGKAIMIEGNHSFTSCSEQAVATGNVTLSDYEILDLIYGTQKVFNQHTNKLIEKYFKEGGKVLMSAANDGGPQIGGHTTGIMSDKSKSMVSGCGLNFHIYRTINAHSYSVPAPTVIAPTSSSFPILTYSDGSYAGIAQPKRYVRLGFPLESICETSKLNALTAAFIKFLNE